MTKEKKTESSKGSLTELERNGWWCSLKGRATTDDVVRSRTMSRIKSKDTSIEVALRKALWNAGIRYRKNYKKLPGTPDIAITKHKVAVFCDGEFWHGKDWESKKDEIHSNREYWIKKIERNIDRDIEVNRVICGNGWTVIRFWGNEIRDNLAGCVEEIKDVIFHSKIDSPDSSVMICDLYPCWLLSNHDNDSAVDEAELYQQKVKDLPCFGSSYEMPCQDM